MTVLFLLNCLKLLTDSEGSSGSRYEPDICYLLPLSPLMLAL